MGLQTCFKLSDGSRIEVCYVKEDTCHRIYPNSTWVTSYDNFIAGTQLNKVVSCNCLTASAKKKNRFQISYRNGMVLAAQCECQTQSSNLIRCMTFVDCRSSSLSTPSPSLWLLSLRGCRWQSPFPWPTPYSGCRQTTTLFASWRRARPWAAPPTFAATRRAR